MMRDVGSRHKLIVEIPALLTICLNDFGKINNACIFIYIMGIKLYNYIM